MSSTIGAKETFRVATQSLADVNGPASYLGWGWLSISVPNLIVILVMIVLFVLAIVLPFPKDRDGHDRPRRVPICRSSTTAVPRCGPLACAGAWMATLPPDKLLPDRQPAYVASWIYVFGVLTIAAFLVDLAAPASFSPSPARPGTTRPLWAGSPTARTSGASSCSSCSWSSTCGGSSGWPPGAAVER